MYNWRGGFLERAVESLQYAIIEKYGAQAPAAELRQFIQKISPKHGDAYWKRGRTSKVLVSHLLRTIFC